MRPGLGGGEVPAPPSRWGDPEPWKRVARALAARGGVFSVEPRGEGGRTNKTCHWKLNRPGVNGPGEKRASCVTGTSSGGNKQVITTKLLRAFSTKLSPELDSETC